MEPQAEPGTQRLELPVSRTTLNSWGGVPKAIVLKSASGQIFVMPTHPQVNLHCAFRKFSTGTS